MSEIRCDRPIAPAEEPFIAWARRGIGRLWRGWTETVQRPSPIVDDPFEALERTADKIAFHCPLDSYSHYMGLGFNRWNPFVGTAASISAGHCTSYDDSPLRRYYETWQPANAAEALIGFDSAPHRFGNLPPYMALAVPWFRPQLSWVTNIVERAIMHDHAPLGRPDITLRDGYKYWGPVSDDLGRLEYRRIQSLVHSIARSGYRRPRRDVRATILKRDSELLFLTGGGGMHRVSVMKGLGQQSIPAVPRRVVDIKEVKCWPQVQAGTWTARDAEQYFHHLFDFDYRSWAEDLELAPKPVSRTTRTRAPV